MAASGRQTGGQAGVSRNGLDGIQGPHRGQQALGDSRRGAGLDSGAAIAGGQDRRLLRTFMAALVRDGLRDTPCLAQDAGAWAGSHGQDG